MAKPTSSATSSVCSTESEVSAENSVVGMIAEQEVDGALGRLRHAGAARLPQLLAQLEAGAGVDDVADDQADRERERRHHEEVAEREATDRARRWPPAAPSRCPARACRRSPARSSS